jgi:hypothetical protein
VDEADLKLSDEGDAVLVRVKVQPQARKNALAGVHDGLLKVAVNEPPEKGKANEAVRKLLAKCLGISRSRVAIVAGHSSRVKAVTIQGMSAQKLQERLHQLLRELTEG